MFDAADKLAEDPRVEYFQDLFTVGNDRQFSGDGTLRQVGGRGRDPFAAFTGRQSEETTHDAH